MSASWVAASVRAKALARRRIGAAGARALASAPGLAEALRILADSPYGHDVHVDQSLSEAQHGVAATLLWHLRVLGGWVPRDGAETVRVLVGAFEVANVDELAREVSGRPPGPMFRLGTMATAWNRLSTASSLPTLRETLATSVWGDPGSDTPAAIHLGMRLAWLTRVANRVPQAASWASGAAALQIARERYVAERPLTSAATRLVLPLLGAEATEIAGASTGRLIEFAAAVAPEARWALHDVAKPTDLWRAEVTWWHRVQHDGFVMLRRPEFAAAPVVGATAVLASDAWRVRAALETAARQQPLEVFDGVA